MIALKAATAAGVLLTIISVPAPAVAQQDLRKMINWCLNKNNPTAQQRIQGCTAAINSRRFKGEILASAYQNRALAYMGINKLDDAMKDAEETLRLAPAAPEAHITVGHLHSLRGRSEEAIASMTAAMALNPKVVVAYFNRGNIYHAMGNHEKALADFDKAQSLDPKYQPIYNNRANTKIALKRYDEALADASVAITLLKPGDPKPNRALVYGTRAQAYVELKRYDLALKDLNTAIDLAPAAQYIRTRMVVHELAGKPELGLSDADRLIAMDVNDALAWNSRCWINAIANRLEQALADCEKGLALAPHTAHLLDSRGFVFLKMGKYDEAIASYTAALALDGYEDGGKVSESISYHLYGRGLARQRKGEMLGGTVDVTRAKSANPELPERLAKYLAQ
jgi:tetratricopeptide (TPR) repeat protein